MSKNTLQSLDRALNLLEMMAKSQKPMSAAELSKMLGINRTTVYAMLNSLSAKQYIEKDESTGQYTIGYKLFELGNMYRYKYPFIASAEMHTASLVEKWTASAYLSIYKEGGNVLILMVQLPIGTPFFLDTGHVMPAHSTASGKLLLSHLEDTLMNNELNKLELKKYTSKTITTKEGLLENFKLIKKRDYSFDDEEYFDGTSCIAVPIRDMSSNVVAALSLSGATKLFEKNYDEMLLDTQRAGRVISAGMGWRAT